jgi:hypothetical protein
MHEEEHKHNSNSFKERYRSNSFTQRYPRVRRIVLLVETLIWLYE